MRLVLSVALQHVDKGLDLDDLVYEGIKGLKKAGEKFDLTKGYAFSTYAYPWIKEYIRIALASALPITLPRHVYKLLVKVRAIKQRLSSDFGRPPTDEELASVMGISIERFDIVRRALALADRSNNGTPLTSSLSTTSYDESTWEPVLTDLEGSLLENVVSLEMQPEETATHAIMSSAVIEALQSLPDDESSAILKRLEVGGNGRSKMAESELSQTLYQNGVRRLRRKVVSGQILFQDKSLFIQV